MAVGWFESLWAYVYLLTCRKGRILIPFLSGLVPNMRLPFILLPQVRIQSTLFTLLSIYSYIVYFALTKRTKISKKWPWLTHDLLLPVVIRI